MYDHMREVLFPIIMQTRSHLESVHFVFVDGFSLERLHALLKLKPGRGGKSE